MSRAGTDLRKLPTAFSEFIRNTNEALFHDDAWYDSVAFEKDFGSSMSSRRSYIKGNKGGCGIRIGKRVLEKKKERIDAGDDSTYEFEPELDKDGRVIPY